MKFKLVGANGFEIALSHDVLPRIDEQVVYTDSEERIVATVYQVFHDLDRKTVKVYVR